MKDLVCCILNYGNNHKKFRQEENIVSEFYTLKRRMHMNSSQGKLDDEILNRILRMEIVRHLA